MIKILKVKIDNLTLGQVIDKIDKWIKESQKTHLVATINPEILFLAQKDENYQEILNSADLSIADGTGIMWASKKYKNKLKEKITGIDLIYELAKISSQKNYRWYLLGGEQGIAKKASNKLKDLYPNIKIIKSESGGKLDINDLDGKKELVKTIKNLNIDILVVCFGAPKQEMFINHFKNELGAKIAIGAGGSLDFISGRSKRAPKLLRKIGLEWLWRFIWQPRRIRRIYNAVIKFPLSVLKDLKENY